MKNKPKVYIIRGTGLSIDGLIVEVVGEGTDGFVFFRPFGNKNVAKSALLVDKRYLQLLGDDTKIYSYVFNIEQKLEGGPSSTCYFSIEDCPRNISLESIKTFIENNLKPILRLE